MKRAFCVIAGACSLLGWAPADEAGMKNALADWQMRQSDWESAFKTAESDEKRAELMESRPNAIPVAQELWRQVGRDLQKPETQKPYLLPAVIWFLDHPQAVAQAFPNGDVAQENCRALPGLPGKYPVPGKGSGKSGVCVEQLPRPCAAALFWNKSRITTSFRKTRGCPPWGWPW